MKLHITLDMAKTTLTLINLIQFCGLFEGEGCISPYHGSSVQMRVHSTDEDVIQWMADIGIPGGYNGPYDGNIGHTDGYARKPIWTWTCYKKEAVLWLLPQMLPFLKSRRKLRALEMLTRLGWEPEGKNDAAD